MSGRWNPESRAKMAEATRRSWLDPEVRRARLAGSRKGGRPKLNPVCKTKQLTAKITEQDYDLVLRVAKAKNLTFAEVLRDYLEDGLAKDVEHHHYKASNVQATP